HTTPPPPRTPLVPYTPLFRSPGWSENDETVIFSPSYGQLDYYAPVLLALAKEYRDPRAQNLALWDKTLGSLQQTRYITRSGEQLDRKSTRLNSSHVKISYAVF